jgi:hypothetical protein
LFGTSHLYIVLAILFFLISKIPFFRKSAIGKNLLIILFFIKVCAGITYAKFYTLPKYYSGADTWRFYRLSANETNWLLNDPISFTKDLFTYSYSKSGNLFSGENSYWNDLKSNIVIKMMAVINVLTNNSYYTNIIAFNFIFLFGIVAYSSCLMKFTLIRNGLLSLAFFYYLLLFFGAVAYIKTGLFFQLQE